MWGLQTKSLSWGLHNSKLTMVYTYNYSITLGYNSYGLFYYSNPIIWYNLFFFTKIHITGPHIFLSQEAMASPARIPSGSSPKFPPALQSWLQRLFVHVGAQRSLDQGSQYPGSFWLNGGELTQFFTRGNPWNQATEVFVQWFIPRYDGLDGLIRMIWTEHSASHRTYLGNPEMGKTSSVTTILWAKGGIFWGMLRNHQHLGKAVALPLI